MLTVIANIALIGYVAVAVCIFVYHLGEAWLSGTPIGGAWSATLGVVYGFMWPAILVGFIIWIIWDAYKS